MSKRILIVDDDHDILVALADRLKRLGFNPRMAEDGQAALVAIEREAPDLVLLDLELPRVSGFEVLKALRLESSDGRLPLPVIIMTAFLGANAAQAAVEAGVRGFLSKPFDWKQLSQLLQHVLGDPAGENAVLQGQP